MSENLNVCERFMTNTVANDAFLHALKRTFFFCHLFECEYTRNARHKEKKLRKARGDERKVGGQRTVAKHSRQLRVIVPHNLKAFLFSFLCGRSTVFIPNRTQVSSKTFRGIQVRD